MIRYLVSLLLGMIVGVAAFALLVYLNPFTEQDSLSPLTVSSNPIMSLSYSTAASDALVYTNNGETRIQPQPEKVLQLWEATVRSTSASANLLNDSRGGLAAIGIKFASHSEGTNLLNGEALVESVWHIYIPGRGTLFVDQTENYWSYMREIVIPAFWSSADNWKGSWHGTLTSGPGVLGLGRVSGGSGEFANFESVAAESVSARAYSVDEGPVAIDAQLTIELPPVAADLADESEN